MGLFHFDIAKMRRFSEVFFNNRLNEEPVSDESDEVVFFIPMIPMNHSDKHKKKRAYLSICPLIQDSNNESNPICMSLRAGLNSHKFLV